MVAVEATDDSSCILLMRHGTHRDGRLTVAGKRDLKNVAEALYDVAAEQELRLGRICWVRSGTASQQEENEVEASARLVCEVLRRRAGGTTNLGVEEALSPRLPGAYEHSETASTNLRAISNLLTKEVAGDDGRRAVLLVGNAPGINWLAGGLIGQPISLQRSEVACLRRTRKRQWWNPRRWLQGRDWKKYKWWSLKRWFRPANWDLLWTIAPSDPATSDKLTAKIKSKMDVAKVFGGVVTAIFTFLVRELFGKDLDSWLALGALYLIAASAVLYFATLFAYDSLQMPTRFWGESRPQGEPPRWLVRRPPSSDTWVLYQNMLRAWNRLFIPATALLAAGLILLGADALQESTRVAEPDAATNAATTASDALELWPDATVGLAVTAVALWFWIRYHRPRFGAQD